MSIRIVCCVLFCAVTLFSCQSNKPDNVPVVGEFDAVAIAQDTTLQLGLEASYEYHKTLVVNKHLVYDVVGYGGSLTKGHFAVLQRGEDNRADTIVQGTREGLIADSFLADSNKNYQPEIYIVIQNPAKISDKKILRFEPERIR